MSQSSTDPIFLRPVWYFWWIFALGVVFAARTIDFQFDADDLRFLWWAHTHVYTPWQAFTEEPLFGQYFRPLISLVWWLHYILLGPDAFFHQCALGVWWCLILLGLYQWGRVYESVLAGCIAALLFLLMHAGHHILLWKSWLTSICSILFQLCTLLNLFQYIQDPKRNTLVRFFLFYGLAVCCKQSATLCLSVSVPAMILCASGPSLAVRLWILGWVVFADGILLILDPSLRTLFKHNTTAPPPFSDYISIAAFYADTIWNGWILKSVGIAVIFYYLLIRLRAYGRAILAGLVFGFLVYWVKTRYAISTEQAWGLVLMGLPHILWFTPLRAQIAAPLAWLMVSFWMLPLTLWRWIPYAADCGVALSLVLAPLVSIVLIRAYLVIQRRWRPKREFLAMAISLGILAGLPWMIQASYRDLNHWVEYNLINEHLPNRLILETCKHEAKFIIDGRPIYADLGNWQTTETALAIDWNYYRNIRFLLQPPPPNAYRMEAYIGKKYRINPSETPLNLWVEAPYAPHATLLADPYFAPERWHVHTLSTANELDGWNSNARQVLQGYPIGVYGSHIVFDHTDMKNPLRITLDSPKLPQDVPDDANWALTFWVQSPRWEWVESLSVQWVYGNQIFSWDSIELEDWSPYSPWKRALLHQENAQKIPISENQEMNGRVQWTVQIHTAMNPMGILLGLDEVRWSIPK